MKTRKKHVLLLTLFLAGIFTLFIGIRYGDHKNMELATPVENIPAEEVPWDPDIEIPPEKVFVDPSESKDELKAEESKANDVEIKKIKKKRSKIKKNFEKTEKSYNAENRKKQKRAKPQDNLYFVQEEDNQKYAKYKRALNNIHTNIENQVTLNVINRKPNQEAPLDEFDRFIISDEGADTFSD